MTTRPAPHRPLVHLLLAVLLALMAGLPRHADAAPDAIDVADFRGSSEIVLATTPEFVVTEADLFLFSVMTGAVSPQTVVQWRAVNGSQRRSLQQAIDLYLQMRLAAAAEGEPPTAAQREFDLRAQRVFAAPAAELVWADRVVRQTVRLFPEDILFNYRRNVALFSSRSSVTVRRLLVPVAAGASLDERNAALLRAERLREEARLAGGLAPILAREPELCMDPAGEPFILREGEEGIDPQVRAEAFRLGIAQLSPVIKTPEGMILIELLDRQPAQLRPLAEVRNQIVATLQRSMLRLQYDYLLAKEIQRSYAVNYGRLLMVMPEDADVVRVRKFSLTREELVRLYPEVLGDDARPTRSQVTALVDRIIAGEVATQQIEALGLDEEPFYREALEQARDLVRAGRYIRRQRREMEPTPEEERAFIAQYREEFQPGLARQVWRLEMSLIDPSRMSQAELDAMRILTNRYMTQITARAEEIMAERRELTPDRILVNPEPIMRLVPGPGDDRIRTSFRPVGAVTRADARALLGIDHADLVPGRFTAPEVQSDGTTISYYAGEIEEQRPVDEETVRAMARNELLRRRATAAIEARVEQWRTNGQLVYHELLR